MAPPFSKRRTCSCASYLCRFAIRGEDVALPVVGAAAWVRVSRPRRCCRAPRRLDEMLTPNATIRPVRSSGRVLSRFWVAEGCLHSHSACRWGIRAYLVVGADEANHRPCAAGVLLLRLLNCSGPCRPPVFLSRLCRPACYGAVESASGARVAAGGVALSLACARPQSNGATVAAGVFVFTRLGAASS